MISGVSSPRVLPDRWRVSRARSAATVAIATSTPHCDGVFRTRARIGDLVSQGLGIAAIGSTVLAAPLDGVLTGLTHDGVPVTIRTKVIEVDPRRRLAEVRGIRGTTTTDCRGVLWAIRDRVC